MSLVSDPAFLGAALRLDHLRRSHDPASPHVLSVPAAPTVFAPALPPQLLALSLHYDDPHHLDSSRPPAQAERDAGIPHHLHDDRSGDTEGLLYPDLAADYADVDGNDTFPPLAPAPDGAGRKSAALPIPASLTAFLTPPQHKLAGSPSDIPPRLPSASADGSLHAEAHVGTAAPSDHSHISISRITDPDAFPALRLLNSPRMDPIKTPGAMTQPPASSPAPTGAANRYASDTHPTQSHDHHDSASLPPKPQEAAAAETSSSHWPREEQGPPSNVSVLPDQALKPPADTVTGADVRGRHAPGMNLGAGAEQNLVMAPAFRQYRPAANAAAEARKAARRERLAKLTATATSSHIPPAATSAAQSGTETSNTSLERHNTSRTNRYANRADSLGARAPSHSDHEPPDIVRPSATDEYVRTMPVPSGGARAHGNARVASASAPFPQPLPGEQSATVTPRRRSGSSPMNGVANVLENRRRSSAATIAASAASAAATIGSGPAALLQRRRSGSRGPGAGSATVSKQTLFPITTHDARASQDSVASITASTGSSSLTRQGTSVLHANAPGATLTTTPESPAREGAGFGSNEHVPDSPPAAGFPSVVDVSALTSGSSLMSQHVSPFLRDKQSSRGQSTDRSAHQDSMGGPHGATKSALGIGPDLQGEPDLLHSQLNAAEGLESHLAPASDEAKLLPQVSSPRLQSIVRPDGNSLVYSPDGHDTSLEAGTGSDLSPPRVSEVQAAAERIHKEADARRQRWSRIAFGAEGADAPYMKDTKLARNHSLQRKPDARGGIPSRYTEDGEAAAGTGRPRFPRYRDDLFGPKLSPSRFQNRMEQIQSGPSALSKRLRSADKGPRNPFAALYAGTAARSAGSTPVISIGLYFPWSSPQPEAREIKSTVVSEVNVHQRRMTLRMRREATIDEVIGFGLFCYLEEQWAPTLPTATSNVPGWAGSKEDQITTIGWELRMVEDGEVDDDYPALRRDLTLAGFGAQDSSTFAIVPADPDAIANNRAQYAQLQRRITRTNASDQARGAGDGSEAGRRTTDPGGSADASGAATSGAGGVVPAGPPSAVHSPGPRAEAMMASSLGTSVTLGKSMGAMGAAGTMTFLRVLVTPSQDVRYTTTVQVSAEMYLADVLDLICRKRQLAHPSEWALVARSNRLPPSALTSATGDGKTVVIPLDRTVASLQGQRDLALVRRSSLAVKDAALTSLSTDPNAPIFGLDATHLKSDQDLSSIYKTWTVNRKTSMFVGKHEQRILTLDGDWLHITAADTRAFNARMLSYPLNSITACGISTKGKQFVKLFVEKDMRSPKRYDFEAQSSNDAADIVQSINVIRHSLGLPA